MIARRHPGPAAVALAATLAAALAVCATAPTSRRVAGTCTQLRASSAYLSEGPARGYDATASLKASGTYHAAVIFVDFRDAPAPSGGSTMTQAIGMVYRGVSFITGMSHGLLRIAVTPTLRWFRMPKPSSAYTYLTYAGQLAYFRDAIAAADPSVDFTGDSIVYIVGPPSTRLPNSPTFRAAPGTVVADGADLDHGVTTGRDFFPYGQDIIPHETSHMLGLPDLYAFTGAIDTIHRYVGSWDLMGDIFHPEGLLTWHRLKLGWLSPSQFVCAPAGRTTTATITPAETPVGIKAIVVQTSPSTAVVVEDRQRIGADAGVCDTGALAYTVDSRVATGHGPVGVVGGTAGGCGYGDLSDAPLHPGETARIGGVRVRVDAARGSELSISVTVAH